MSAPYGDERETQSWPGGCTVQSRLYAVSDCGRQDKGRFGLEAEIEVVGTAETQSFPTAELSVSAEVGVCGRPASFCV